MAFLELLAAPARAGIVAPDVRIGILVGLAIRLGLLGRRRGRTPRSGLADRIARDRRFAQGLFGRRVADVASFEDVCLGRLDGLRLFGRRDLQAQDRAHEILVHAGGQGGERGVGLVFVFGQRIALAERAQPDAGAQVVHLLQVRHPTDVDDIEHDLAAELLERVFSERGLLAAVHA